MKFEPGYNGTALERFVAKCRFDPGTGCVIWTGGTTRGRGHSAPYGSFWFEDRRWFAHRWAAKFIHGLEIDELQVDHCCDHLPVSTLCVHHLQAIPPSLNRELQWIRAQVGLEQPPPSRDEEFVEVPFFDPPRWYTDAGGQTCLHPSPAFDTARAPVSGISCGRSTSGRRALARSGISPPSIIGSGI